MTIKHRKLVSNSLAILANQLTQNLTAFALSILIARILGPFELGQYSLAFSYYFIFMTMSSQGLKTLFTRELSRSPEKIQLFLVSGTLLQLCFSLIAYAVLVFVVYLLPYSSETFIICCIVGAALIPFSLSNVTEAIFQAREIMHLIAISTVPVYILRLISIFILLKLGGNIYVVGGILVLSEIIVVLIEWGFVLRRFSPIDWKIDYDFMKRTATAARTFLAIESVAVVKVRMHVVILSLLAGEHIVGLFSAAVQLLQPFQLISQSLVLSVFPTMSKNQGAGEDRQRKIAEGIISLLLIVGMPMIIGFFFIGSQFMVFVYRNPDFFEAGIILNIVSLSLIPLAVTRSLSYLLMARGYERINLRTVTLTTIAGAVMSVILIAQFQMVGAAVAAFLIELATAIQFTYAVSKRLFWIRLWNIIRAPLVVSAVMLLVFAILQNVSHEILVIIGVAGAAYVIVAGFTAVQLLGLQESIRARLLPRA